MNSKTMSGKTCLITGATGGIGKATALALAQQGAELYIVCRNKAKGETLLANIKQQTGNEQCHLLMGDLAKLDDIKQVAAEFLSTGKPLHVLVNNAGIFNQERRTTAEGLEEMFAVNHLGYFLLTHLLLERLKASAPSRIVSVASGAYLFCKGLNINDLNYEQGFKPFVTYGHSKLCNILWTQELARQLDGTGVTANCLHPGAVRSELGSGGGIIKRIMKRVSNLFLLSPEKGARSSIYLATSPEVTNSNGEYFVRCKPASLKSYATDEIAIKRLWTATEELLFAGQNC